MTKRVRMLTKKQQLVYVLDAEGLTPTEIAKRLNMGLSRVANIKTRLKQLGFDVAQFRGLKARLEEVGLAKPEPSSMEPADDELPDLDEPTVAVSRCHCGLILPCYHPPVEAWRNGSHYQPAWAPPSREGGSSGVDSEW